MIDRYAEAIEKHVKHLQAFLAMMEAGDLQTHQKGKDTTEQTVEKTRDWIDDLEAAVDRHKVNIAEANVNAGKSGALTDSQSAVVTESI